MNWIFNHFFRELEGCYSRKAPCWLECNSLTALQAACPVSSEASRILLTVEFKRYNSKTSLCIENVQVVVQALKVLPSTH